MNNFRINHSFDNNEAARHVRCSKGKGSQQFNHSVQRGRGNLQTHNQFSSAANGSNNTSITKSNFQRLSNSSGQTYGNLNVQITQFALQAISQIVGLISNLINSLGFESGGPGNLIGTNGGGAIGGTGNFGYQPISNGSGNISINVPPGSGYSGHYQNGGQTIVINLPGGHGGQPTPPTTPPTTPQPPVTPPREAPKAGDTYIRLGPIDGASKTGELSGQDRPNPREISNAVADQDGQQTSNKNNASDLLWSWGQFIDHDMILTKEGEEKAYISVPRGDPDLDPAHTGNSYIPFTRSHAEADENGNREQVNEQTALIDGSMIYGATEEKTAELRSHEGGKLKIGDDGHLLPDPEEKVLSGDPRAAEQPGLLSLQTLFVREHNRQADLIASKYPDWSDDQIFDEARRIVSNEIQAITYNEFLPVLLGGEAPVSAYAQYDPATVNGQVSSEFSTAAFRLGHTMVNDTIAYKDDQGKLKQATLDEVFFQPEFTQKEGIGSVLSGQSDQKAQAVDPKIVDSLRNRLFGPPQAGGPGMDLASLNIQRGRDHNVATYNDMREAMGYQRIESFDDPIFQDGVGAQLAEVYDSPDDIDLWVGGLAEKPLGNSMLGATFTSIVDEQFARTAAADPNFYTKTASAEEIAWLNQLSLADIVRANSTDAYIDDTPFIVD